MLNAADVYGAEELLERLSATMGSRQKPIVFVLGSAVSYHEKDGHRFGVPLVQGIVELIKSKFAEKQKSSLENEIEFADNPYQQAFRFLLGRRGPEVANLVIKEAISLARGELPVGGATTYQFTSDMSDQVCASFEADLSGWRLPPAAESFGRLAVAYPDIFGKLAITTNFDPLLAIPSPLHNGTQARWIPLFRTFSMEPISRT